MDNREIDKEIAEKVFGEEFCNNPDHAFLSVIGGNLGRLRCPCCDMEEPIILNYSTHIEAAWEVVDKLRIEKEMEFALTTIRNDWKYRFKAIFYYGDRPQNPDAYCYSEIAPMAICLAALKALNTHEG